MSYDEIIKELEQLDKEELVRRLAMYEFIFQHIDPMTRYYLMSIGKLCRGVKRNFEPIYGVLYGIKFEVKELEIWVEERIRRWNEKTDLWERKTVTVPWSSLQYFEIIEESKEVPKEEKEEEGITQL